MVADVVWKLANSFADPVSDDSGGRSVVAVHHCHLVAIEHVLCVDVGTEVSAQLESDLPSALQSMEEAGFSLMKEDCFEIILTNSETNGPKIVGCRRRRCSRQRSGHQNKFSKDSLNLD